MSPERPLAKAPLIALVKIAGIRWAVEESFRAAKGQVGLDHYQVRTWTAWHRHSTLALLALAVLMVIAAAQPPAPPRPHPADPARDPPADPPALRA